LALLLRNRPALLMVARPTPAGVPMSPALSYCFIHRSDNSLRGSYFGRPQQVDNFSRATDYPRSTAQCLRIHLPGLANPQLRCRCSPALFPLVTAHSEVIVATPTQRTRHLALHRSARRLGVRDFPEARFGTVGRASVEHTYRHSLGDSRLLRPGRKRSTDSNLFVSFCEVIPGLAPAFLIPTHI